MLNDIDAACSAGVLDHFAELLKARSRRDHALALYPIESSSGRCSPLSPYLSPLSHWRLISSFAATLLGPTADVVGGCPQDWNHGLLICESEDDQEEKANWGRHYCQRCDVATTVPNAMSDDH